MSGKVIIYQFRIYDISSDEFRTSRRWGLRDVIEKIHGAQVIEATSIEVDAVEVHSEYPGLTRIGYNPHARRSGFQTRITS